MTTQSNEAIQHFRSAPVAWLYWLGGIVAFAAIWVYRSFVPKTVPVQLTRSEEKQRRKALFREHQHRH